MNHKKELLRSLWGGLLYKGLGIARVSQRHRKSFNSLVVKSQPYGRAVTCNPMGPLHILSPTTVAPNPTKKVGYDSLIPHLISKPKLYTLKP